MGKTSIEWTDVSWPLVNGCRRISPGCENCYAERLTATRLRETPKYKGLAVYKEGRGPQWTGATRLWEPDLSMPIKMRKPSRIFVADMGDLFFEDVSDDTVLSVFGAMILAPWHTYQVLTKRASRMRSLINRLSELGPDGANELCMEALLRRAPFPMSRDVGNRAAAAYGVLGLNPDKCYWPLPWVHLGVSVENQKYADERIPELLATPAALRFVSYEPALGGVDFSEYLALPHEWVEAKLATTREHRVMTRGVQWVICGGESGIGARPFDLSWARAVRDQCAAANVPFFFKQAGADPFETGVGLLDDDDPGAIDVCAVRLENRKGGDFDDPGFPADLKIREFPKARHVS